MDFMISMFGSETTGKPKNRRRTRVGSGSDHVMSETNHVRGRSENLGESDLPPEEEEGNVEYKLKLVNPSPSRLQHLVTQLKWRLREGQGEAIYEIGVEDNGVCAGLTDRELDASLSTLRRMAEKLDASFNILRERELSVNDSPRRRVVEVLVRKVPENQQFLDLRIAVLGCADAGKSTLLGVLTQGELDNGRGKARLNLFRHLHEVQSGRTSSISLDVVGFDSEGNLINYADHSVEEICEKSTKLVTLIDLAGHQKYLKTTIFGLTGYRPHYVMLVVAADMGVVGTTREHLGLAMALQVPVFVVVTKIDRTTPIVLNRTLHNLEALLKSPGCKKIPTRIETEDDAISAGVSFDRECISPIFIVSSVSGDNMETLEKFLNVLPPSSCCSNQQQHIVKEPEEFHIDEIFNVPQVGVVAAGLLTKGCIKEGDELLVGPDQRGDFVCVRVESLHRNKTQCRVVQAGQAASLALSLPTNGDGDMMLRKGMVVVHRSICPIASIAFEAEVFVLFHPSPYICIGFQTTVHIGNVCQTATIIDMDKACLKTTEASRVTFVFLKQPEYITETSRLLFREGKTKGIGQVTKVCLDPNSFPFYANIKRTKTP